MKIAKVANFTLFLLILNYPLIYGIVYGIYITGEQLTVIIAERGGDVLSAGGIASCIRTPGVFRVEYRDTVSSTNGLLRDMAAKGAPEGLVIAAGGQTAGRGRLGRTFYSPAGHGAYFSLLLRPGVKPGDATLITSAAAVATARAIEDVTGACVGIKWVNDLFLDGRKVCGILTEATFGMESGLVESAVLGIGVNITTPENGYPDELEGVAASLKDGSANAVEKIATSLKDGSANAAERIATASANGIPNEAVGAATAPASGTAGSDGGLRCRIIAATLDIFWRYYRNLTAREFLGEYRERSVVLGKSIFVLSGDSRRAAKALAIDDDCRLIVRYENAAGNGSYGGENAAGNGSYGGESANGNGSYGGENANGGENAVGEIAALDSGEVSIRTE